MARRWRRTWASRPCRPRSSRRLSRSCTRSRRAVPRSGHSHHPPPAVAGARTGSAYRLAWRDLPMASLSRPIQPHATRSRLPDLVFRAGTRFVAAGMVVLLASIAVMLVLSSTQTWGTFGLSFLTGTTWDPVAGIYGALPFVVGTLVTAALAMIVATPIGLLTAIFLAELAPRWLAVPLGFLVELIAAIPSVVIGLWGVFVLSPFLGSTIEEWLARAVGTSGS